MLSESLREKRNLVAEKLITKEKNVRFLRNLHTVLQGFTGDSITKESVCNEWDLGSILGLRRSPREGNGNSLKYPCLGNPMDRETWWATVHVVTRVRYDSVTKRQEQQAIKMHWSIQSPWGSAFLEAFIRNSLKTAFEILERKSPALLH